MRAALLASLIGVSACDSVFSVDHVPGIVPPDAASDICVQDSFGAPLDTAMWMVSGESDGLVLYTGSDLLHIDVPAETSSTQSTFGGVHTGLRNLVGASIETEVVQVADTTQPSSTGILLTVDGSNQYRLVVSRGQVVAEKIIAKATTNVAAATFDPVKHRFLRIRHDAVANQVMFETRGKTTDYEVMGQISAELNFVLMDTWLYAQSFNSMAQPFSAQYDSVLVTGPSCH